MNSERQNWQLMDYPVAMWEEDLSEAVKMIEENNGYSNPLQSGIEPDQINQIAEKININEVNEHCLKLFGSDNRKQLLDYLNSDFLRDNYEVMIEKISAIKQDKSFHSATFSTMTLNNKQLDLLMTSVLPEDGNFKKIWVSLNDLGEKMGETTGNLLQKKSWLLAGTQRLDFLSRAGETLNSSLNVDEILSRLSNLVVPVLASWCVVDLVEDNYELKRIMFENQDPEKADWIAALEKWYPGNSLVEFGPYHVLKSGKPEVIQIRNMGGNISSAPGREHLEKLDELGVRSVRIYPLATHNKIFGTLSLIITKTNEEYARQDILISEDLAKRAALAIENARLYEQLQQFNSELELRVIQRTAALEETNRNLREQIISRQKAETKLNEKEAHFRLMVESIKDYAIFMLDAEGKIKSWNAGARKMKGYTRNEILNKNFSIFYTPEDVDKGLPGQLLSRAKKAGRSEMEGWRIRKDGSKFWADVICTALFNPEGKLTGFAKVTRDVTEKMQAEKQLREQKMQLQEANRELEMFSYSVSHDLRSPLRAIHGFSKILLEDYRENLDTEGKRLLNVVTENTDKMSMLIEDLLSFSRMKRIDLTKEEVDVEAIVKEIFEEKVESEKDRDINFHIETISPVTGDASTLRILWTNLISNAIKFTRNREKAEIRVGSMAENGEIVYHIKDNGVGFDMRYSDKLFGVFQRFHKQKEFEGTGIGLAIVKRIVDRHGGSVSAWSEPGSGTIIRFKLPETGESSGRTD